MKAYRLLVYALLAMLSGSAVWLSAQSAEEFIASSKAKSAAHDKFGAIADLDHAIALNPNRPIAFLQRANARLAAIDYSDLPVFDAPPPPIDNETLFNGAISDLDRAIALNPNYAEAYKARGDALAHPLIRAGKRNDRKSVIADYTNAIRAKTDFFEAYYSRALQRGIAGDQAGCDADIEQALVINPDFIPALEMRVSSRRQTRDFSGAIADTDRAIAAVLADDPAIIAKFRENMRNVPPPAKEQRAHLLSLRSALKRQNDNVSGALADLNEAILIYPTNGYYYSARGSMKQEQGDFIGAVADYAAYKELTGELAGTRSPVVIVDDAGKQTPFPRRADFVHLHLYCALGRLQTGSIVMELKPIVAEWGEGWPKTVGLYLTGGVSEPELLEKARRGDAATVVRQECQAFYYIGMRRLITRQPEEAEGLFEQAVATQQKDLNEFRFARAELAGLTAPQNTSGVNRRTDETIRPDSPRSLTQ